MKADALKLKGLLETKRRDGEHNQCCKINTVYFHDDSMVYIFQASEISQKGYDILIQNLFDVVL